MSRTHSRPRLSPSVPALLLLSSPATATDPWPHMLHMHHVPHLQHDCSWPTILALLLLLLLCSLCSHAAISHPPSPSPSLLHVYQTLAAESHTEMQLRTPEPCSSAIAAAKDVAGRQLLLKDADREERKRGREEEKSVGGSNLYLSAYLQATCQHLKRERERETNSRIRQWQQWQIEAEQEAQRLTSARFDSESSR